MIIVSMGMARYRTQLFLLALTALWCLCSAQATWFDRKNRARTITVDPRGHGDFSTIQSAIDAVPRNNDQWFRIHVKSGIYREKVQIPTNKPYISLIGEGKRSTQVVWDDHDNLAQSPTFTSSADNIEVQRMTFVNSYNAPENKNPMVAAVAAYVRGDKSYFYDVRFVGVQDTLWDDSGRHYFHHCTIVGAVDFIFGKGQSIYENCAIRVLGEALPPRVPGFITAQGRDDPNGENGYVFKKCHVFGRGSAYLGRPWRDYSRVIFYDSEFTDVVEPKGWDAWNFQGMEYQLTYAEAGCRGKGANMSERVGWEKTLSNEMLAELTSMSFINAEEWLQGLPT